MPHRSRYGRVDPRNPMAAARCDAGGEIVRRVDLRPQMMWAGNRLVSTGMLVCARHYDKPNAQDRTLILGPDPVPVRDPRPNIDMPAPVTAPGLLDITFTLDASPLA